MPKLAFVDIGAHRGQSAQVALGPYFAFSKVICFEPDPACASHIANELAADIRSGRLDVQNAALGARNGKTVLFGSNAGGGASLLQGGTGGQAVEGVDCKVIDVLDVLQELDRQGFVSFLKLNCEGAEVEILDRICEGGATTRIASIMADFDIVKYAGGFQEKQRVLARCRRAGLPICLSEDVMVGRTHEERLRNWLARFPEVKSERNADLPRPQMLKRKLKYWLRDRRSLMGLQKHQSR